MNSGGGGGGEHAGAGGAGAAGAGGMLGVHTGPSLLCLSHMRGATPRRPLASLSPAVPCVRPPSLPLDAGGAGREAPAVKDLKQLSGGERSYTTVAFALALGGQTDMPFRAMGAA